MKSKTTETKSETQQNTINTCKPINENKDKENKEIQHKNNKT